MLKDITRSKLIQMWFVAVLLIVGAVIAAHVSVTASTGVMLLALSVVPPTLVFLLWPRKVQPITASEVLHGARRD